MKAPFLADMMVVFLAAASPAADPDPALPDAELLESLSAWVAAEMGLRGPVPAPMIEFVSGPEMAATLSAASAHPLNSSDTANVEALYHAPTGRMILRKTWQDGSLEQISILVHELVHHAQFFTKRKFACYAELEDEAFRIQEKWLELTGRNLSTAFGLNKLSRLVLTNCTM